VNAVDECEDVRAHLRNGDFTFLTPHFSRNGDQEPAIVRLHRTGCFTDHPAELAEALTCACFVGAIDAAEYLIAAGVPPSGGSGTGMNAMHWAANRGQLAAVQLLLRHGAQLETRNAYGGTVLGAAVWAAVHETKPAHIAVIEALLEAGAAVHEAGYPSGDSAIDALLVRFGARNAGGDHT
jgi:hypothetical protein